MATIDEKFSVLLSSKEKFYKLIQEMLQADNGKIFPLDFYAIGIVHRSILLNKGFCKLIKEKNFLCAAPLIRLHLDSLLQFYAAFIVKDPHNFATKKMKGKQTNNLKDVDDNEMTDGYLASSLSKKEGFAWVKNVYNETSKFIHFSDKHIFSSVKISDQNKFSALVSDEMNIPDSAALEAIDSMIEITNGLFKYIYGWVYTKKNPHLTNQYDR